MRRTWSAFLLSVLMAACSAPVATPTAMPGPAAAPAGTAVASSMPVAAPVPPTPAAAPAPSAATQQAALIELGRTATYRVSYTRTKAATGVLVGYRQTEYAMPPKRRTDHFIPGGGPLPRWSFFVLETGMFDCSTLGGSLTCRQVILDDLLWSTNDQAPFDWRTLSVVAKGTRQIAGHQASCFDTNDPSYPSDVNTFCYSAQGVPLLIGYRSPTGETLTEATAYTTDVSDDDFKLPAPPQ